WRTLAGVLLFLAGGVYAPPAAAPASSPLPEVGSTLCSPQGVLIIYSERYVAEDDGVLVFRRRPVEVYTAAGASGGSYAPIGDAPVRLDVPPGTYIVASQRQGVLQKVRASVTGGEETIVPESLPEPPSPHVLVSPR